MKLKMIVFCVLTALMFHVPCNARERNELRIVPYADVNRYMGAWFEIAKIPHWFEKGLAGTMINFELLDDGKVLVTVQAYKNNFEGKYYSKILTAEIADRQTNTTIVVDFFLFFTGTFYVVELGGNYDYAVVGNESREKAWILSRSPRISPELYDDLLKRMQMNGFDISKLEKTIQ